MKQNLISLPNKIAHHRFKKVIFDIETEGLEGNTIHCIVAKVIGGGTYLFPPDKLQEGADLIESADVLIGHNIIGFDIPVLKKHFDLNLTNHIEDTLVVSRLVNPVLTGGHSLENWGYILYPNDADKRKAQQPDSWEEYTEEMGEYCIQDVELNADVYYKLLEQVENFSQESIDLEHAVAKIVKEQEQNGFMLDEKKATLLAAKLNSKMAEIEKKVHETFKPKWVDDKLVTPKLRKDGTLSKVGLTNEEMAKCLKTNNFKPFMRQKWVTFNLGSRKQIGEYLIDFGWKPTKFTPTGQPIVDETTLEKVKDIPEATLIAEFMMLQKRVAQVSSWLELSKESRVHGFVISNGAITGRMTHRNPNVAQTPSSTKPYGKECRECWTVPEGYKLVGIDASGLELRVLAHYMKNKEYVNEIINGDIHSTNQSLAGLGSRSQAKTFIYALIYGAGDAKIGSVVGGNAKAGATLRSSFIRNLPSLGNLTTAVERAAQTRKYVKALDGRVIHIRKVYSALNTLLQGGGAVIMKTALVLLYNKIKELNLDAKFVANIHDEWQIEVREDQAETVGKLGVEAIQDTSTLLNLNCPLDGEYKIGENWSETH
jgi:DNA polymerase I-like protein with 3'-5' exonuclease and polymerase domains|tara:strand:- start:1461 stop:3254 length:1794 start_codon:yes stop_codon:yes gene_type:complete